MDSFDLFKVPRLRVHNAIHSKYGGRFSRKEIIEKRGIGAAGLTFIQSGNGEDIKLKVNIETFREGIGIYFRNIEHNKVLLFRYDELERIRISKEADVLVQKNFSFFKGLQKAGLDYYWSRIFLLDSEVISTYKVEVKIVPKDYDAIVLFCTRKNPNPTIRFLQQLHPAVDVNTSIRLFQFIEEGIGQ